MKGQIIPRTGTHGHASGSGAGSLAPTQAAPGTASGRSSGSHASGTGSSVSHQHQHAQAAGGRSKLRPQPEGGPGHAGNLKAASGAGNLKGQGVSSPQAAAARGPQAASGSQGDSEAGGATSSAGPLPGPGAAPSGSAPPSIPLGRPRVPLWRVWARGPPRAVDAPEEDPVAVAARGAGRRRQGSLRDPLSEGRRGGLGASGASLSLVPPGVLLPGSTAGGSAIASAGAGSGMPPDQDVCGSLGSQLCVSDWTTVLAVVTRVAPVDHPRAALERLLHALFPCRSDAMWMYLRWSLDWAQVAAQVRAACVRLPTPRPGPAADLRSLPLAVALLPASKGSPQAAAAGVGVTGTAAAPGGSASGPAGDGGPLPVGPPTSPVRALARGPGAQAQDGTGRPLAVATSSSSQAASVLTVPMLSLSQPLPDSDNDAGVDWTRFSGRPSTGGSVGSGGDVSTRPHSAATSGSGPGALQLEAVPTGTQSLAGSASGHPVRANSSAGSGSGSGSGVAVPVPPLGLLSQAGAAGTGSHLKQAGARRPGASPQAQAASGPGGRHARR